MDIHMEVMDIMEVMEVMEDMEVIEVMQVTTLASVQQKPRPMLSHGMEHMDMESTSQ